MKKNAKKILIMIFIIIIAGVSVIGFNRALPVEVVTITPVTAEMYFIEQGYVKTGDNVEIYPQVSGEILSVNVTEGQSVEKGDILCSVDPGQYEHELKQAESMVSGYRAQAENLNLEEQRQKDAQRNNLYSLRHELDALLVQEKSAQVSRDAQIRLQNILIEQSRTDLEFADDERIRGEVLFQHGAISESEYNKLRLAVESARTMLETQKQQLEIIKSGPGQSAPEYFKSMVAALRAQIAGIESSLNKSYIRAMRDYYNSQVSAGADTVDRLNKKIEQCDITSPFNGRVVSLPSKNANIVSQSTPIAVINSENEKMIEVFVSTADINSISVNDKVEITANRRERDYAFSGVVQRIDPMATVKLSALGVEERKVKISIIPESVTEISLGDNFDVDVRFLTYKEDKKYIVPKTAVYEDAKTGEDTVFVIRNGRAVARKIEKGLELRTDYTVESGLEDGEIVIRDATTEGLSANTRVKPI